VTLVACGTASYACHVAKYWFEQIAGLPADIDIASEFRYREPACRPPRWRSSSASRARPPTRWPRCAMCEGQGGAVVSVVNVPTSSIARESDLALPILAGVEVGVASTKAFTCQLTVLALMALKAAQDRAGSERRHAEGASLPLRALPGLMNAALALSTRSPGSPKIWPRRRTCCSLAAARCSAGPGRRAEA
jgi:glucosamine--fructose-6-phosphate aminotransferase (isomerizing)